MCKRKSAIEEHVAETLASSDETVFLASPGAARFALGSSLLNLKFPSQCLCLKMRSMHSSTVHGDCVKVIHTAAQAGETD